MTFEQADAAVKDAEAEINRIRGRLQSLTETLTAHGVTSVEEARVKIADLEQQAAVLEQQVVDAEAEFAQAMQAAGGVG